MVKLVPVRVTVVPPAVDPLVGDKLDKVGMIGMVTELLVAAVPVPKILVAVTLKVYESPSVSEEKVVLVAGGLPVTVTGVTEVLVVVLIPLTVYEIGEAPPVLEGALQETPTAVPLTIAFTGEGAPGAPKFRPNMTF